MIKMWSKRSPSPFVFVNTWGLQVKLIESSHHQVEELNVDSSKAEVNLRQKWWKQEEEQRGKRWPHKIHSQGVHRLHRRIKLWEAGGHEGPDPVHGTRFMMGYEKDTIYESSRQSACVQISPAIHAVGQFLARVTESQGEQEEQQM